MSFFRHTISANTLTSASLAWGAVTLAAAPERARGSVPVFLTNNIDRPLRYTPVGTDLATRKIRVLEMNSFKGRGGKISGGAATVLELPLDSTKELKSLTVRALANEVVIGLMSVTLQR